jgi:hypothetical protein
VQCTTGGGPGHPRGGHHGRRQQSRPTGAVPRPLRRRRGGALSSRRRARGACGRRLRERSRGWPHPAGSERRPPLRSARCPATQRRAASLPAGRPPSSGLVGAVVVVLSRRRRGGPSSPVPQPASPIADPGAAVRWGCPSRERDSRRRASRSAPCADVGRAAATAPGRVAAPCTCPPLHSRAAPARLGPRRRARASCSLRRGDTGQARHELRPSSSRRSVTQWTSDAPRVGRRRRGRAHGHPGRAPPGRRRASAHRARRAAVVADVLARDVHGTGPADVAVRWVCAARAGAAVWVAGSPRALLLARGLGGRCRACRRPLRPAR